MHANVLSKRECENDELLASGKFNLTMRLGAACTRLQENEIARAVDEPATEAVDVVARRQRRRS